jgi:hypothetical protein
VTAAVVVGSARVIFGALALEKERPREQSRSRGNMPSDIGCVNDVLPVHEVLLCEIYKVAGIAYSADKQGVG